MNDIHDLLGAYCTDALDPQERAGFEEHLADCDQCRDEAADFREVLAALADAHPVHPPSSLEDAVMDRARSEGGSPARTRGTGAAAPLPAHSAGAGTSAAIPASSAWRRAAPWMAAAAAGAVLFAGGFGLGRQQSPTQAASGVSDDMAAIVAVASAADAHVMPVDIMGTTSRVVTSGEMDKSVFLASGLPTPAKGMCYQVWTVTDDGQIVSAGAFTPDADGHIAVVLEGGAAGVDKFMITMEPPGGSEHPSGTMLAEVDA